MISIARRLELSGTAVIKAVKHIEKLAKENNYSLLDKYVLKFKTSPNILQKL